MSWIGELRCIECFLHEGKLNAADFVVNGQSVCQKHVHVTVVDRAHGPMAYTWHNDFEEPALMPVASKVTDLT